MTTECDDTASEPLQTLGSWRLEKRIGSGGLADVWRATKEGAARPVALKVLREPDRSPQHRDRFLREGRLLERLSHQGLPRFISLELQPQPAIALELLGGDTLSAEIRSHRPIEVSLVEHLASRLLQVLAYLHEKGIVHRDIKPSNIWLADDRRVLLLDLGLAADVADPLTTTLGDILGTYAYMSPEQIAGAEVDHRTDLYSLGVTLYETLAGRRPFRGSGAASYLRAHRTGNPPDLREIRPDTPPRLLNLIRRLMSRDPADRPASAGVAQALLVGATVSEAALRQPPLVGRAAAVGAIEAALDGAQSILIVGDLGSGTGRMASWAIWRARDSNIETIAVRCRERGAPNDPIEQLVRDLTMMSGQVRREPEHIARALDALAGESSLLLVIEDIDRTAPDTIKLLLEIIQTTRGVSVVITSTVSLPLFQGHTVTLRSLTLRETRKMLVGMLGTPTPPGGLAEDLQQLSGGLPAIIVLAIKELMHRGALVPEGVADDGHTLWRLDRTVPMEPTTGLVRLFGKVLASLTPPSRRLLEVLCVVGESVPLSTALTLAEVSADGLCAHPLVRGGLATLERHADGEWIALRRPALAPLVLEQVRHSRRTAIHRRLAASLRELPADPWREDQIIWHTAHGAAADEAEEALLQLAQSLHSRGHNGKALEVVTRAMQHETDTTGLSIQAAILRGEILNALARRSEAIESLDAARRLAGEHGLQSLQARAISALAHALHGRGDEVAAAQLADEVISLLDESPDDPSLPMALLLSATSRRLRAESDEALLLYRRCFDTARAQGDSATEAMASGGIGILLAEEGHLEEALKYFSEETAYLRVHGQAQTLVPALFRTAITLRRRGLIVQSLETLDEAEDIARFSRLPYESARVNTARAAVYLTCGDLATTERLLRRAKIALQPEADSFLRLAYREVQSELRLQRRDHQSALAVLQAAEAEARGSGYVVHRAFFLGMVGVLTADSDALMESMDVLGVSGDRQLAGRLLLWGSRIGDDHEVLEGAEEEARNSNDVFLLLRVLYELGHQNAHQEAHQICVGLLSHMPRELRTTFRSNRVARWALAPMVDVPKQNPVT